MFVVIITSFILAFNCVFGCDLFVSKFILVINWRGGSWITFPAIRPTTIWTAGAVLSVTLDIKFRQEGEQPVSQNGL